MNQAVFRSNLTKIIILSVLALAAATAYMLTDVNFANEKLFLYAMKIRTPKLIVMILTAFAIGGASIVFQSVINNRIVTPCLLGMNSLYTLIHTVVVFLAGSGSILATNANAAFAVDLGIMGVTATVIYSYLFQKTKYNVLYVLLIGTVLTSFFGSIQSTLTRVMDPNEYDSLLSTLVASFSNVNGEIIVFALVVLAAILFFLRRDLALLDVLTLGKEQAINLVVNLEQWNDQVFYDRLGTNEEFTTILDMKIPSITIPIKPGRNLAIIIEVAAMNNRHKRMGYNAAQEFAKQLDAHFEQMMLDSQLDAADDYDEYESLHSDEEETD